MPIELICQGCASKLRVPEEHAGKQARCPSCGAVTPVPAAAALYSRPDAGPTQHSIGQPQDRAAAPQSDFSSAPTAPYPQPAPSASAGAAVGPNGPSGAASVQASGTGRWFMRSEVGQTYGPVTKEELDRWVAEGRVSARAFLAPEGAAEWQPAGNLYPQLVPQWTGPMPQTGGQPGSANPWADQAANPYAAGGAFRQGYVRPHRGGAILTCGILSWVICMILGVIAIVMAREDLRLMRSGQMDPSGMGMTQAGMILGWIHVGLTLAVIAFTIIASVIGEMN